MWPLARRAFSEELAALDEEERRQHEAEATAAQAQAAGGFVQGQSEAWAAAEGGEEGQQGSEGGLEELAGYEVDMGVEEEREAQGFDDDSYYESR